MQNAVISTCAISCLNHGVEVVGIMHGYSHLIDFTPDKPLEVDKDYIELNELMLRRTRSKQGIIIGTARSNPGKFVSSPEDMKDTEKVEPLRKTYEALRSIGVDALVSIGGDDTLKTANKFKLFQDSLPEGSARISCLNHGVEVVGIMHGYSHLSDFTPDKPLEVDKDY